MCYLHSLDIVYRNLKLANILIDDYFYPKICDFEISTFIDDIKTSQTVKNTTLKIMAPEFIEDFDKYNRAKPIDVYSFSMVLYEFLTNEDPYNTDNPIEIIEKVMKGEKPELIDTIPNCYKKLISECWSQVPEKRPTFAEIVKTLETNKEFVQNVDEAEFRKYINYVKGQQQISHEHEEIHRIEIIEDNTKIHLSLISDPIDLNKFTKLKNNIGYGSFGKAYKVVDKKSKEILACKISNSLLEFCDDDLLKCIERELNILSEIKFPSILKFYGYSLNNFKQESRPTFITEYASNGSLDKILEKERLGLSIDEWNDTKKLINIYGIAIGMSYLHSLDILHRDLKPGNIFIDEYLFPKICDFGVSKKIQKEISKEKISYLRGTPAYISPEILRDNNYIKASDVYAFAFIVYEIVTCTTLYENIIPWNLMMMVKSGYRPSIQSDVPKCYKDLIESCWSNDPEQRPTFDEIVENLKNNPDFITNTVDQDEFYDYVDYIDSIISPKKESKNHVFHKISIDYEAKEESYDNDPNIKKYFLDLSLFEKVKKINNGPNWKLYQIKNKETGQFYSAKIITLKLAKMSKKEIVNLSREINNISQIKHPTILKFIGYSLTDFSSKNQPVIVTEFSFNGTMSSILEKERKCKKVLNWDETQKFINIYGIAVGMKFLHFHNIIHRDLTPENIFLDNNLYPKIGNFGLSLAIHMQKSMTFQSTIGVKGNPVYTAPEVLSKNEYSKSSDVYSFGLLVYSILTSKIPFENIKNVNNLLNEIVSNCSRPEIDGSVSDCYRNLIEKCWIQNPENRPSFDEIVNILDNEKGFITDKINEDDFSSYKKYIETAKIDFFSDNKIFNQNQIIESKKIETDF